MKRALLVFILLIALVFTFYQSAFAIPALQLYIEGSNYDASEESWITTASSFKLWVLGDVKSYGTIFDIKLAFAYPTGEIGSVSYSPTTTGLLTDPSVPINPYDQVNGADGTVPLLGDGSPLPTHGIYGPGTSWTSYRTGDLTLTDSPIGDFITTFPSSFPSSGQINVYDVTVSGYSSVHFDAFDHIVVGQNHANYKFAPFSHDASVIPEPASFMLLGLGLLGIIGLRRRVHRVIRNGY